MRTVFLRALDADDKALAVLQAISVPGSERQFEVDVSEFSSVPGSPFSYWVSDELRRTFGNLPAFETGARTARQGLATADDFRFVRAWWEVQPTQQKRWVCFAKGGAFSPYYADIFLVVDWQGEGRALNAFSGSVIRNPRYYMRPGITWPLRTNGLSFRVMPSGGVFGHKGPAAFIEGDDHETLLALTAIINSTAFERLVSLQLARTELAQSFEVGLIQQTPVPELAEDRTQQLASLAHRAWQLKRDADTWVETSHAFMRPALLQVAGPNLSSRVSAWQTAAGEIKDEIASIQAEVDAICLELYGIAEAGASPPEPNEDQKPLDVSTLDDGEDEDEEISEVVGTYASSLILASDLASWTMGVAFGRFDLRLANGARELPVTPGPFDALPLCSPGMLTDSLGSSACVAPAEYPISPADTGVIVDDVGHPDDLSEHVKIIFEEVFGTDADAWLSDVTATLNPAGGGLRRWFADQFFDYHLRRYTKSKRKAPIYWQLAAPSGRYSIWLYAIRLTSDTFFKLLHDVVAPKLAHEEHTLTSLLHGTETVSGRERQEIEDQENFVAELRQMADEIRRIAPLWNPNLDDGVVLVMAPLWRLVPQHKAWQKELRTKWQDLQSGKYDWAHLAMHLWPERVVPKCATDRSLAIAHGLEEVFWSADESGKWKPRLKPLGSVEDLVAEHTSPAVKEALKSLLEAPEPVASAKRGRKVKTS